MMSGGIQVFDMIKRHNENESLRKNIKYFKTRGTYLRTAGSLNIDYRTATKEELLEIRRRVLDDRRKERVKSITALLLSLLGTGILVYVLLKFLLP